MFENKSVLSAEVTEILNMLSYKRPAWSATEEHWIKKFIMPMRDHENVTNHWVDKTGNLFFEVCGGSKQLFTAHTDTMHWRGNAAKGTAMTSLAAGFSRPLVDTGTIEKQKVVYDPFMGVAYKDDNEPLGADDGVGVWLCLEIIRGGVPCTVAFYRAEERGGIGSSASAQEDEKFYNQFTSAVAFDRRGTKDIITHQRGGRCASNIWAEALAESLNAHGLEYAPCNGGVFTDTANLTSLVPECSNLSVGYQHEHSGDETQDVEHLLALRDAIINVDWGSLPIVREPGVSEFGLWMPSGRKWCSPAPLFDDGKDWGDSWKTPKVEDEQEILAFEEICAMSLKEMEDFAYDYPELFARSVYAMLQYDPESDGDE